MDTKYESEHKVDFGEENSAAAPARILFTKLSWLVHLIYCSLTAASLRRVHPYFSRFRLQSGVMNPLLYLFTHPSKLWYMAAARSKESYGPVQNLHSVTLSHKIVSTYTSRPSFPLYVQTRVCSSAEFTSSVFALWLFTAASSWKWVLGLVFSNCSYNCQHQT